MAHMTDLSANVWRFAYHMLREREFCIAQFPAQKGLGYVARKETDNGLLELRASWPTGLLGVAEVWRLAGPNWGEQLQVTEDLEREKALERARDDAREPGAIWEPHREPMGLGNESGFTVIRDGDRLVDDVMQVDMRCVKCLEDMGMLVIADNDSYTPEEKQYSIKEYDQDIDDSPGGWLGRYEENGEKIELHGIYPHSLLGVALIYQRWGYRCWDLNQDVPDFEPAEEGWNDLEEDES